MNAAEKIAGAYLRLNGFLLLPHFTAFCGDQHNHIDLIGLRARNSREVVGGITLMTDDLLFETLSEVVGRNSRFVTLGVAAEVRTNARRDSPSVAHTNYIANFLGGARVTRISFYEGSHSVVRNRSVLDIGIKYAGLWIRERIDWMNEHNSFLSKDGSWTLSEDFLSDYLALCRNGLLTSDRNPD